MESHGGVGSTTVASGAENLIIATLDIRMHDLAAAARRVDTTKIDGKNIADVASLAMVRALIAEEAGDPQGAANAWDEFRSAYSNPLVYSYNPPFICSAAVSYEKTGQSAKANAALRPTGGRTYTSCYRFSGDVLDLRGDWRGAQEWYAKAVKLAPSLPAGYYSWGVALAKHGDLAGAAEKLALANQKGPHWADPLKAWGDVLLKQGKSREALAKYDEARKYAPNWKLLKEARESVSQHPSSS
jgi:tetratricopeptide (TPR) repeat protein